MPELDFAALTHLSIGTADDETFRCLKACKKAIRKGGLAPALPTWRKRSRRCAFPAGMRSASLISAVWSRGIVDSDTFGGDYTLADVHECDRMARAYVEAHI